MMQNFIENTEDLPSNCVPEKMEEVGEAMGGGAGSVFPGGRIAPVHRFCFLCFCMWLFFILILQIVVVLMDLMVLMV